MPFEELIELIKNKENVFDMVEYYVQADDKKNNPDKETVPQNIIGSGDTQEILTYLQEHSEKLSLYAVSFLANRVRVLNALAETKKKHEEVSKDSNIEGEGSDVTNREFRQLYGSLRLQAQFAMENDSIAEADKQKAVDYKGKIDALTAYLKERLDSRQPETQETYAQMMEKSIEARRALNELKEVLPELYKASNEVLDKIDGIITGIDPADMVTLDSKVAGKARPVLTLNNAPDHTGAVSSRRYLMSMKKADGTEVEGYFSNETKMLQIGHSDRIDRMIEEALKKEPDNKILHDFIGAAKASKYGTDSIVLAMKSKARQEKEREYNKRAKEKAKNEHQVYNPPKTIKGYYPETFDSLNITGDGTKLTIDDLKADKGVMSLLDKIRGSYTENEVSSIRTEYMQYALESGTGVGAEEASVRVGRNYALAKVASLLGISDLVPKTTQVTASFDGKLYNGIFMEKAKGGNFPIMREDVALSEFMNVTRDAFDGKILEKLAAIQVLDYICGNVDRHSRNMLYSMEGNIITDVMAIDNDLSFGTKVMPSSGRLQNGVKLDHIMVIPESMHDLMEKTPKETLMGVLSDTGLTKEEIEAAGTRYDTLKKYTRDYQNTEEKPKPGCIKIVGKEEWKQLMLRDLSLDFEKSNGTTSKNTSIFTRVRGLVDAATNTRKYYNNNRDEFNALKENDDLVKANERERALKGERVYPQYEEATEVGSLSADDLAGFINNLKKYVSNFSDTESLIHRTTESYDAMKKAVVDLSEEKLSGEMNLEEFRALEQRLEEVQSVTEAYIKHKEDNPDKSKTGTKRLDEAKKLRDYLVSYREHVHEAGNIKEEEQLEKEYREFLKEREAVNEKLDIITGTITRMLIADNEIENTARLEEVIKSDKDFQTMLSRHESINGGADTLDYFADMAINNPEKLKGLYESIKLGRSMPQERIDDYLTASAIDMIKDPATMQAGIKSAKLKDTFENIQYAAQMGDEKAAKYVDEVASSNWIKTADKALAFVGKTLDILNERKTSLLASETEKAAELDEKIKLYATPEGRERLISSIAEELNYRAGKPQDSPEIVRLKEAMGYLKTANEYEKMVEICQYLTRSNPDIDKIVDDPMDDIKQEYIDYLNENIPELTLDDYAADAYSVPENDEFWKRTEQLEQVKKELLDHSEKSLVFYKKWYEEAAGRKAVADYFEGNIADGVRNALYDRDLFKDVSRNEDIRKLFKADAKPSEIRKISGIKQTIAQFATKMYDDNAGVYEKLAAKYGYERFMSKYKGTDYADIPMRELAFNRGVMKLLVSHLEANVSENDALEYLTGMADFDVKHSINNVINKYALSKEEIVDNLLKDYEKYDAGIDAEAQMQGDEAVNERESAKVEKEVPIKKNSMV